jgi:hypothetical protein
MNTAKLRRWAGQSRRLREGRVIAIQTGARLAKVGHGKPIFLNSIPKSGTHLLMQALDEMDGIRPTGVHLQKAKVVRDGSEPVERSRDIAWDKVEKVLRRNARPGQYMSAHIWAQPELFEQLTTNGYSILFMIRDPRDVVVSQAAYVKRLRRHPDHERFSRALESDQDRYRAIIEGYGADESGPVGVSLAERLEGFAPWLDHPDVLTCRFEDLIGPSGGGSRDVQTATLRKVAAAIGAPLDAAEAEALSGQVWSPRSATFNKGRIGGWRESFDDRTRELFDTVVGRELMDKYGYAA